MCGEILMVVPLGYSRGKCSTGLWHTEEQREHLMVGVQMFKSCIPVLTVIADANLMGREQVL